MENVVIVTKNPKTGLVFTPNNGLGKDGEQWGYYRVESRQMVSNNGMTRLNKRSALQAIREKDFNELKSVIKDGAKFNGKVIFLDSLTDEKGYKPMEVLDRTTGELKPVTSNGKQVYRRSQFTEDLTATDVKLAYDKASVVVAQEAVAQHTEAVNLAQ